MYIDFLPISVYYVRMSPRIRKDTIKDYRPILGIEARDALTELAGSLGFIVTRQGAYNGLPSVPDMLTALAAAHDRDPGETNLALKVLLGENDLLPDSDGEKGIGSDTKIGERVVSEGRR